MKLYLSVGGYVAQGILKSSTDTSPKVFEQRVTKIQSKGKAVQSTSAQPSKSMRSRRMSGRFVTVVAEAQLVI